MVKKAISPEVYRKKRFSEEMVETPSGASFKIKKISPVEFIEEGMSDIPNPFLEFIIEGKADKFEGVMKDEESANFMEKFLDIVIEKGILEPKVFVKYDKNRKEEGLLWAEIEDADKSFLLARIAGLEVKNV